MTARLTGKWDMWELLNFVGAARTALEESWDPVKVGLAEGEKYIVDEALRVLSENVSLPGHKKGEQCRASEELAMAILRGFAYGHRNALPGYKEHWAPDWEKFYRVRGLERPQ